MVSKVFIYVFVTNININVYLQYNDTIRLDDVKQCIKLDIKDHINNII